MRVQPKAGRRRCLRALGGVALCGAAACATPRAEPAAWENRLRGDALVLLGEVHDHAPLQRLRLAVLRRALAAGWRPALAMEQFDIDRQPDIDRARREQPGDAAHLIAQAASEHGGWDWSLYRPVIALALDHELPLFAANLSRGDASRLVRGGYAGVLGAARAEALGLDGPRALRPDAAWQAAQQREIDAGHCGRLPAELLPGMARAQFARDAVMADVLARHAARGIVLLAGNGHVRRDLGVPRWLRGALASRALSVGFVEAEDAQALRAAFDALVLAPALSRSDDRCAHVAAPQARATITHCALLPDPP